MDYNLKKLANFFKSSLRIDRVSDPQVKAIGIRICKVLTRKQPKCCDMAPLNEKAGNFFGIERIQFPYWKTNMVNMTPCENQEFVFANNFDEIFEQSVNFVIF